MVATQFSVCCWIRRGVVEHRQSFQFASFIAAYIWFEYITIFVCKSKRMCVACSSGCLTVRQKFFYHLSNVRRWWKIKTNRKVFAAKRKISICDSSSSALWCWPARVQTESNDRHAAITLWFELTALHLSCSRFFRFRQKLWARVSENTRFLSCINVRLI